LKLAITIRHFEPPEEFRGAIENKLKTCVEKYFREGTAHVTVSMEGQRYLVEADINIKGASFHAREETRNLQDATDSVIEKIGTQARRYKGRKKNHKQKGGDVPR